MEIWKLVYGYEERYEVSNIGNIRSTKGRKYGRGVLFNPKPTKRGYHRVTLRKDKMKKCVFVHTLVLEAFVCPRPEGMVTNHKNSKQSDNRVENLEWVTQKENVHHAIESGNFFTPQGEQHGESKLTTEQVKQIREMFATGIYTKAAIARQFGVTDVLIGLIVRRSAWKHV